MNKRIFLLGGVLLLLSSPIFSAAGGGGAVGRGASAASDGGRSFKPVDGDIGDSESDSNPDDHDSEVIEELDYEEELLKGNLNRALRKFRQYLDSDYQNLCENDLCFSPSQQYDFVLQSIDNFTTFINALKEYKKKFHKLPIRYSKKIEDTYIPNTYCKDINQRGGNVVELWDILSDTYKTKYKLDYSSFVVPEYSNEEAATKIQKVYRGHQGRKRAQDVRRAREEA